MRKVFILFAGLIIMFIGCVTPSNLRNDGATLTFIAKGIPKEFSHCLIGQLDEKLFLNTHSLRENPNGNVTILTKTGDGMFILIFDISKEGKGLNILVYDRWCSYKDQPWMERMCLKLTEMLNACGANEKRN